MVRHRKVLAHVGFFLFSATLFDVISETKPTADILLYWPFLRLKLSGEEKSDLVEYLKANAMNEHKLTMAQQVAQAASDFQEQRTGHAPKAVTVVLSENALVVTMHEALSPAEKNLAQSPAGAAQVQDFHRQLFTSSSDALRREIRRITGVEVREATAEIETTSGTVVHAFTTGTMVQVFLLAHGVPAAAWNGSKQAIHQET